MIVLIVIYVKVCPVLHSGKPRKPLNVYAAKNKDEKIRLQSSSGGVFSSLAEAIINAGGVVFGAKFDEEWKVVHGYTETKDGIADFRGSKYVQSWMGDNFSKVKYFWIMEERFYFQVLLVKWQD